MDIEEIACQIVDSALKVHRALGPGLLESAYQACLAYDLRRRGRQVECEVPMPLEFEGTRIDVGYRLDMRVEGVIVVENKTVEELLLPRSLRAYKEGPSAALLSGCGAI